MSTKYYNINDEEVRTTPKNGTPQFNADEKYAVIEGQEPIQNEGYNSTLALSNKKFDKKEKIKNKTASILSNGFTHNSNTFSLDIGAWVSWNSLILAINNNATLEFPYYIKNIDDEPIAFSNSQEIIDCFNAGVVTVGQIIGIEGNLLNSINNASDFTTLDAVTDDR
jgi:hypothetical protein